MRRACVLALWLAGSTLFAQAILAQAIFSQALRAQEPGASAIKGPFDQAQDRPGEDTTVIVKAVIAHVEARHLSAHPVDNEIGQRMLTVLLRDFDSNKLYFTKADVQGLREKQDELDDELRRGELTMVYDFHKLYLQRLEQRIALADELLNDQHDFSVDEEFLVSPDQEYAEDDAEVRELWRKRVKYQLLVHSAAGSAPEEARKLARRQFQDTLARARRNNDDDVLSFAMNALTGAFDPQSTYMTRRAYEDFLIGTRAQLVGIGASLQLADGYVTVTKVFSSGPAGRDARLRAGDRVVAVGQGEGEMTPVVGVPLTETVNLIRGKDGSAVRLRVLPKGAFEAKVYTLTRGKVELERVASALLTGDQLPEGRAAKLGYVHVPSIYGTIGGVESQSVSTDVRRALDEFKKDNVDALVLDLRNNSGGTLTQAMEVAALFVGNGTTLRAVDREGKVENYGIPEGKLAWDGPLVVLTSKVTASGAEIIAAAIQDYRRGLLVGDTKTNGLGTIQNVQEVKQPGAGETASFGVVKTTRQRHYRVSGKSTQLVGVVPDIVLPSPTESSAGQEASLFPLQTDDIEPVKFQALNFGIDADRIRELAARSETRRKDSSYFQKLAESAAANRARPGERHISLNKEKFLAAQKPSGDDGTPVVPGVPDVKLDGYLKETLAISLDYASAVQLAAGNADYQAKRFAEAAKKYKAAVAAAPDSAAAQYKLSWLLATCSETRLRDGKTAVKHAQRACELDPDSWSYVLGLAVAHAQAGDFDSAQKHLKIALDKAPENQRATYRNLEQRFRNRQAY